MKQREVFAIKAYRVGKRVGQNFWQVKEGPGWRIVHKCAALQEAADWLSGKGVDLSDVRVVSHLPGFDIAAGWPTLKAALESEKNEFGSLSLKWREAHNLNRVEAAEKLGVPYRTLEDWEAGRRTPRPILRDLLIKKFLGPVSGLKPQKKRRNLKL